MKLESLQKGTYYVLVHPELDESSYVDQPEFNINAYGPSNVTFSDETLDLQNLLNVNYCGFEHLIGQHT